MVILLESCGEELVCTQTADDVATCEMQDALGPPGEGVHAFTVLDIYGEEVDMRLYRDKVLLIVNVASRDGYTRQQYEDLQTLYTSYQDQGFVVLGFPSNDFRQEPDTNEEILTYVQSQYGVTFPMFSKISVRGEDKNPLFAHLEEESGTSISWSFNKFLVNKTGGVIEHYEAADRPVDETVTSRIEEAL